MKTLADAWKWYQATRQSLGQMLRLGNKHWQDPSLRNGHEQLTKNQLALSASSSGPEAMPSTPRNWRTWSYESMIASISVAERLTLVAFDTIESAEFPVCSWRIDNDCEPKRGVGSNRRA